MKNEEIIGKKFNRLTVLEQVGKNANREKVYHCKCECGKHIRVSGGNLRKGNAKSCGCLRGEQRCNRRIELLGKRFGRLKVVNCSKKSNKKKDIFYICVCDCGRITHVNKHKLKNGNTLSCGCYKERLLSSGTMRRTHGMSNTPEYKIWNHIKDRCYNPEAINYDRYGGKGIKVCDRWLESFENFYEDMGDKPSNKHQLDRINGKKDYSPSNCRWVTSTINNANKDKKDNWGLTINKNKTCRVAISREYIIRTFVFKDRKTAVYYRDKWVKDYEENPKKWIEETKSESYRNDIK